MHNIEDRLDILRYTRVRMDMFCNADYKKTFKCTFYIMRYIFIKFARSLSTSTIYKPGLKLVPNAKQAINTFLLMLTYSYICIYAQGDFAYNNKLDFEF